MDNKDKFKVVKKIAKFISKNTEQFKDEVSEALEISFKDITISESLDIMIKTDKPAGDIKDTFIKTLKKMMDADMKDMRIGIENLFVFTNKSKTVYAINGLKRCNYDPYIENDEE
jgi:Holliday junction resolvase RusA-like endonuclease